jgi:anti-sigma factor RsiW
VSASEPDVREDELHAYVDGQLPSARLSTVTRYLDTRPLEAARIAGYAEQREALRAVVRGTESLPPGLDLRRLLAAQMRRRLQRLVAVAAALALIVGGAGGWFLHSSAPGFRRDYAMSMLEEQALAAHAAYTMDKDHAGGFSGNGGNIISQWLSIRLNRKVAPPDLSGSGYRLIGGRLLATGNGDASALLLYKTGGGQRLSLLMRPMAPGFESPEVEPSRGEWNTCAWVGHGMGYALVAATPRTELDKLVDQIKAELSTG